MSESQGSTMIHDPSTQANLSNQRNAPRPTEPIPFSPAAAPVVYVSTTRNSNIHRKDGAIIPFVLGFFKTQNKADIEFLDNEIDMGHPFIRRADEQEEHNYKLLTDPDTTLRAKVEAEITPILEAKIRAQLEQQIKDGQFVIDHSNTKAPLHTPLTIPQPLTDSQKIQGVDAPKTTQTVDVGGAKVTMVDKNAQLSGMTSTAGLPGASSSSPTTTTPTKK